METTVEFEQNQRIFLQLRENSIYSLAQTRFYYGLICLQIGAADIQTLST